MSLPMLPSTTCLTKLEVMTALAVVGYYAILDSMPGDKVLNVWWGEVDALTRALRYAYPSWYAGCTFTRHWAESLLANASQTMVQECAKLGVDHQWRP